MNELLQLITPDAITAFITTLLFIGSLITLWVNVTTKMKEIDVKILNMQQKFEDIKNERIEVIQFINKLHEKLEQIDNKIDKQFEQLTILQTEHNAQLCQKNIKKRNEKNN